MAKFCNNCGQRVIENPKFCSSCGHQLKEGREEIEEEHTEESLDVNFEKLKSSISIEKPRPTSLDQLWSAPLNPKEIGPGRKGAVSSEDALREMREAGRGGAVPGVIEVKE